MFTVNIYSSMFRGILAVFYSFDADAVCVKTNV